MGMTHLLYSNAPRNSECKHSLESSGLDFLGSRRYPPHLLSSKGPNYQRRVLRISAGAIEGYFEGKTPREDHDNAPSHWHLQPRRNWPTCASNVWITTLFSGSGPVALPPLPWTEKRIEMSPFFVRSEVIPAAETWLDGQTSEFI